MFVPDLPADPVQSQFIINGLQEQVTALEFPALSVGNPAVWMKNNREAVVCFFLFVPFSFNTCLFSGPDHNILSGRAMFNQQLF